MEQKLTLSMDESVIKKAKDFAKKNHISLSQLIESYFITLTKNEKGSKGSGISTSVKKLSGILKLPEHYDFKEDKANHLEKKYK